MPCGTWDLPGPGIKHVSPALAGGFLTTGAPAIVAQSFSRVRLFATPWTAAHQASLSSSLSQRVLKLTSFELMMPSNHPLLPPSPPALSLSQKCPMCYWRRAEHWGSPQVCFFFLNKYPKVANLGMGCRHGWTSGVGFLLLLCAHRG